MKHAALQRTASLALVTMLLMTSIASAHPGHGAQGFQTGLLHPITGLDHVLAMGGVGLLAVGLGKRWMWMLPATFVGSMVFGAALGTAGVFVPSWLAEFGIAGSVFAFGLMITFGVPLPAMIVAVLTGLFAICHGSAHAAEMPVGSSTGAFFIGFTASTLLLHAIGIGLGLAIARQRESFAFRTCGIAMSLCGALMLAGVL